MNDYIPAVAVLVAIALWWIAAHSGNPDPDYYKAGVNEVVAWDGGNCLLVNARSSWNITGDLRHELPASVFNEGNGFYLVAFGHPCFRDGRPVHGRWYKARGRITPRVKHDLVAEIMIGWEHNYACVEALEIIPRCPAPE